jgi:LacI family transcriptional regulator
VISDDVEVGRMAALHLIRRGYRDLVYIGRAGHHYSAERLRGFQEQAEASGCTTFTFDLFGEDHESTLRRELRRLPARAGVFAANDIMARVVMEFTESPAQRIPLQFALLGVDDDPVQCSLCAVPLSSVVLNGFQVGVTAMERLLARLEDPNLPDEVVRIAPVRVETRQSTDLYALEDELAAEILETIDEHLAELSDVSDLVERLGHPRRTLESRFRKATHRTLAKELASVRVERARDLIRNGEDSIEDVARAVGLPDARMLWLLFKRHTGESPSDYRKRVRSG